MWSFSSVGVYHDSFNFPQIALHLLSLGVAYFKIWIWIRLLPFMKYHIYENGYIIGRLEFIWAWM